MHKVVIYLQIEGNWKITIPNPKSPLGELVSTPDLSNITMFSHRNSYHLLFSQMWGIVLTSTHRYRSETWISSFIPFPFSPLFKSMSFFCIIKFQKGLPNLSTSLSLHCHHPCPRYHSLSLNWTLATTTNYQVSFLFPLESIFSRKSCPMNLLKCKSNHIPLPAPLLKKILVVAFHPLKTTKIFNRLSYPFMIRSRLISRLICTSLFFLPISVSILLEDPSICIGLQYPGTFYMLLPLHGILLFIA